MESTKTIKRAEGGGQISAWAAQNDSGHLAPFKISRRPTGPQDVRLNILYCGICHTDLHQIKNQLQESIYPMVPGHEIVGVVTEVGAEVETFKVGQHVGVGCIVHSCRACHSCQLGLEQYCPEMVWTYNSIDADGTLTEGGYSTAIICNQSYVLRMPENLPLDAAAPLLCAGITVWSPMKHFKMVGKGKHFGLVGLGGLGHMAIQFARAFGMEVTVFSRSPSKEKEAREVLGAHNFVISTDEKQMKAASKTIDYIIDTISANHSLDPYLALLKTNGSIVLVGLPKKSLQISAASLIYGRHFVGGSLIGGIEETQEMLDFCGEHNITCMIEKVPITYINTAMARLEKSDVHYRFVIDIVNSLKEDANGV
jgi:D-arabinose 1-dehydrogenase-like Zn-dependent alcohol dehydrogenase